jgi:hypothetical protein
VPRVRPVCDSAAGLKAGRYRYLSSPRSASKIAPANDLTSGDTSPESTDSATVTGSVRTSQIVAPAITTAKTPTMPTRLKLRLPIELFRGRRASIVVPAGILHPAGKLHPPQA